MAQIHQTNNFTKTTVLKESKYLPSSRLSQYENYIANKLGYLGVTLSQFSLNVSGKYNIVPTSFIAQLIFCAYYTNSFIKIIFLCFMARGYFGPLVFFDKIAALCFVLVSSIIFLGTLIYGSRYPFHGKKNELNLIICTYLTNDLKV